MHVRAVPVLQAIAVTILWSLSWVLITLGLQDVPPLVFAGLRYLLAASVLVVIVALSRTARTDLARLDRRQWRAVLLLGVVLYALTQGAQFVALTLMPAATTSLFHSLTPVMVAIGAAAGLRETLHGRARAGLVAVTAGSIGYFTAGGGADASVAGIAVGLIMIASNTAAALLGRRINSTFRVSALAVTTPSMLAGAITLMTVGLAVEGLPTMTPRVWWFVVLLAVVNTAFAFTIWNHTLRSLTAAVSSSINNTMLIQIAVLGVLFLHQPLTAAQWISLVLVAAGTLLICLPAIPGGRRWFR